VLETVARLRFATIAPEERGDAVMREAAIRFQREQRKNGLLLGGGNGNLALVRRQTKRPEERHPQLCRAACRHFSPDRHPISQDCPRRFSVASPACG
jgi:hypothetical protein